MNQSNTYKHYRGTTTVTQKKSLFESIISREVLAGSEVPPPVKVDLNK